MKVNLSFLTALIGLAFLPFLSVSQTTRNDHPREQRWKKHIQIFDTSAALIINRIEEINNTMNDINDVMDNGFDTLEICKQLPDIIKSLQSTKFSITNRGANMGLRRLSILKSSLNESSDQLKDWKSDLFSYSTELVSVNTQIESMMHDSLLRQLPADTSLRNLYALRMNELRTKWTSADSIARKALKRINQFQSIVSENYLLVIELQKQVHILIKTFWQKALGQEYCYLWQKDTVSHHTVGIDTVFRRFYKINSRVLSSYIDENQGLWLIYLVLFFMFFLLLYININKIKRRRQDADEILQRLKYIHTFPWMAALIFILTIAPFFDMHSPFTYTAILQLFLVIVLTVLVKKEWSKKIFYLWLILVSLFEIHSIDTLLFSNYFTPRLWLLLIDSLSIAFCFLLLKNIKEEATLHMAFLKPFVIGYLVLNAGAIGCNLLGRVTLSTLLSNTAIFSFFLALSIMIFIQIFLETVYLQIEADKRSKRFTAYLSYQNIEGRLKRILLVLAGIFWFINFTQNLNLYDNTYSIVSSFLSEERKVGTTSFTLESILVFFLILWIANFIQKYIGYFFGDTGEELPVAKKRIGTSILLIRLLVLTVGFLLGVAASGLPIDKITIVIGALGIGIGLGLQNIVNQLVSGIILAIERPIQVGDTIEIGTKSGRVKDIGIRSCRLITDEGAEIIVPNGDLLSQMITNWTINNNYIRVEIILKLADSLQVSKAQQIILSILNQDEVMQKPEPQVLINNIKQAGVDLQVLFWVYDINKVGLLKSQIWNSIYDKCREEGINFI